MKAIDLFAGAGGSTTGALLAGVDVVWAANHWRAAVDVHAANHPQITHSCQDLHQADWEDVPRHDLLLASPCCQGHSRARGVDRPHHDASRSTAWAVVSCAEFHRPDVVVVENVVEFSAWSLYPSWRDAMHRLGYAVAPHVIDAADHGVPQHRVRLFIVCTRSENPMALNTLRRIRHVPIANVIRWDSGNWSEIERPGRSAATLARIAAGRKRFGRRFVMPYYGSGSGLTGRSIHRPIGTLTTRDRWAIVDGTKMRMVSIDEGKDIMSFPPSYQLPASSKVAMQMLGGAVAPLQMRDLLCAIREAA